MNAIDAADRLNKLRAIAGFAMALLFAKVLLSILAEYRWYFPADFEASAFLSARRHSFFGVYRAAFYAHIVSGPPAVLLGVLLMVSGGRSRYRQVHQLAGRLQVLIVLAVVAPSGLLMAGQATAGTIAMYGFGTLSVATAGTAVAALYQARIRNFRSHRKWATRCFILLASPLLLRLTAGALIVLQQESEWAYRINAWLSWLIPLAIYEVWYRIRATAQPRQGGIHLDSASAAGETMV